MAGVRVVLWWLLSARVRRVYRRLREERRRGGRVLLVGRPWNRSFKVVRTVEG